MNTASASLSRTGTISVDPRFFRYELNTYSNWRQAFWRELVQNSVDAGATRIDVAVGDEDGHCRIGFADNGPGITEEIIRNVYFSLGATNKGGADTIGGHGRARILTCFAHESYSIRTRNLLCTGCGGSYEIDNSQPFEFGCTVGVEISQDDLTFLRFRGEGLWSKRKAQKWKTRKASSPGAMTASSRRMPWRWCAAGER